MIDKERKACVVIFTCNRPQDLKRCLDALQKQTIKETELLVVNNGTDSETQKILASYNVRVINDNTKKLSYLFNLGWKNTNSELLVYLADDVELEPNWLEEAITSLWRHPDVAVITGPLISPFEFTGQMHALYALSQKSKILSLASKFYNNFVLEGKAFEPCVLCESGGYTMGQGFKPNFTEDREVDLATTSGMLIRRSAIEAVGGFDENFMFNHADGDLFIRLKKSGYKIIYNPMMKAFHYNKPGLSRYPFFIGRDTAFFYLKDIRPRNVKGILAAFLNISVLNIYWIYKTVSCRDIKQLSGIVGFLKGFFDYLYLK